MWVEMLGGVLACWLTLLIGVIMGRTRWLIATRATTFSLVPVAMLGILTMGQPASEELCETLQKGSACQVSYSGEGSEWHTTIPSTLFGALTLQALMHFLMGTASASVERKLFVFPCVTIHACTTIYYFFGETVAPTCVLTTRWGNELQPLHYTLWWVSMSAQLLTLYGLERELCQRAGAFQRSAAATTTADAPSVVDSDRMAVRRCAFGLACVPTMLVLTVYVDVLRGPLVTYLGVFGAYYGALFGSVYAMLAACGRHALAANSSSLAFKFRAVAAYFLIAWHVFPTVWALSLLGLLTPLQGRLGYLFCDVLAKFLPITLYMSAALELDN